MDRSITDKKTVTNTISHLQPAALYDLPKLCMVIELVETIKKV